MTVQGVLAAVLRRWYVGVTIIVLIVTVGVAFARDPGFYSTRTVIVFEIPGPRPWEAGGSSESGAIAFALAVANQINGTSGAINYAAEDAPFYGAGIRQGVRVGLPDTGGQWEASYARAAINIDVVSPDRAWVRQQQDAKVQAVQDASDALQTGIPASSRIELTVDQLTTTVEYIQPSRLSRLLAYTALAAVALIVGAWASVVWDERSTTRRRRTRGTHFGNARLERTSS